MVGHPFEIERVGHTGADSRKAQRYTIFSTGSRALEVWYISKRCVLSKYRFRQTWIDTSVSTFPKGKELDFFVEVVCPPPEFLPLAEMNKNKPSPFAYFFGLLAAFKH